MPGVKLWLMGGEVIDSLVASDDDVVRIKETLDRSFGATQSTETVAVPTGTPSYPATTTILVRRIEAYRL